jgi:hypothetical protein
MLGADVLLFPDYGEAFLRSLKTNAIYANRVTSSILLIPEDFEPTIRGWLNLGKEQLVGADLHVNQFWNRSINYVEFVLQIQPTLRLLKGAGVLRAPEPKGLAAAWDTIKQKLAAGYGTPAGVIDAELFIRRFESADPLLLSYLRQAREKMQPNFLDALPFLILGDAIARGNNLGDILRAYAAEGKFSIESATFMLPYIFSTREGPLQEVQLKFFAYLLAVADATFGAEGCPFVWTDPVLQNAMWAVHKILSDTDSGQRRRSPEDLLGANIVQTYLPAVYDLPVDQILEFRTKHESELEAFRSGITELAATIDVTQSPEAVRSQAQDLIRTRVNPAVRDLRAKLKIARLEVLQRIGKSWQSLASLAFSTTIAVLAGAPLAYGGLAGLAGTIGHTVFDGAIERRKLMHASQWAALIQFDDLKS